MAFLWQLPDSRFWIARFTDISGKRRNRSTKVPIKGATRAETDTNRKQAQKIADSFESASRKRQTATRIRTVIAELQKEITGEELASHTVRAFASDWLNGKKAVVAPGSFHFYEAHLDKFLLHLGEKADEDIAEITRADITGFRNAEAKALAAKTVNHGLKVLRMFFKSAKRDLALLENPCEFVDTIRQRSGIKRRPFTMPELKSVLDVANEEWRSMILCGLYTGQRLGDIATMTWQNIDLIKGQLRLITRKTGKTIILPIAPPLLKHLEGMPSSDNPATPLHPQAFETVSRQGKTGNLSNQFGDLLAQAGLREKQAHRKTHGEGRGVGSARSGLSFHCLRHTAVSLLKEAGIPASVVMEYIGHDSEQMSQHYTHTGDEAMTKAAAAFPDILKV